jgi:hypothetical protein
MGLLKVGSEPVVDLFVAGVFAVGFVASLIGIKAIWQGHRYYRRTVVKKTLLEDLLGLTIPAEECSARHTLAIGTTGGQAEHLQILHNTEVWLSRGLQARSITFWIIGVLILLCILNLVGIYGSIWIYYHPGKNLQPTENPRFIPVGALPQPRSSGTTIGVIAVSEVIGAVRRAPPGHRGCG